MQAPLPLAGFQDGFFVQSPTGDNRLVFGMVAQSDGRFSVDAPDEGGTTVHVVLPPYARG